MNEQDQRQAVIAEARTWLRTPHHNGACIKGVGCDCGQLPWACYVAVGLIPAFDIGRYSAQFFMHRNEEWYKGFADQYGHRVDKPLPGDFALFKIGRIYSHGAIVIDWPHIIHAEYGIGVVEGIGDQGRLHNKSPLFYSAWGAK